MEKIIIIGISACLLLVTISNEITTAKPTIENETLSNNIQNSVFLCHIAITGTGCCTTIMGTFLMGFGTCWVLRVKLENSGHIEIRSLFNPSNNIVLEGNHQIYILGFIGYRTNQFDDININGLALSTSWI